MNEMTIAAKCAFGLESALKRELLTMGYKNVSMSDGTACIKGNLEDVYKLNLSLRSANNVLFELYSFKAESFDALFDGIYAYDWASLIPKNGRFDTSKVSSKRSKLFSKGDCQRITTKAIAEKLKASYKITSLTEKGAYYPVCLNILNDTVTVSLNTNGTALNRRAYRLQAGIAPIIETLAAGILIISGYNGSSEFADFMCGSGTFAIEAAMIASKTAPNINRSFAFEDWGVLDEKKKVCIKNELLSAIHEPQNRILASDVDGRMIKTAMENAKRAGTNEYIAFQKMDFRSFASRKKNGIIVCNPPYAERLGDKKDVEALYADMRDVYEALPQWKLNVLCANPEFQRCFGRKADKNRKLYNGNMLSYLYTYDYMQRMSPLTTNDDDVTAN